MKQKLLILLFLLITTLGFSQYQLNGSANQQSCNCYELTPALNGQVGSVWNINLISLNQPFDFIFDIFLGCNNNGADGLVFGLQPVGTGIGTAGGGIGLGGVVPSLGVYIDTWQNGGNSDPAGDHVSINANGDLNHNGGVNDLAGPVVIPNIEDCQWHTLRITWDPVTTTMNVYVDGNLTTTYTGNIVANIFGGNPNIFWGFTSATGGANNQHQFCTALTADWSVPAAGTSCFGSPVQFSNTSTSFSSTLSWIWDFGDSNTSTLESPSHTYSAPGTYNVSLTITNTSTGCSNTFTSTVEVVTLPVDAGPDQFLCTGLTGTSTIGADPIVVSDGSSYTWNNGGGSGTIALNGPAQDNGQVTVSPVANTTYTVNVTDINGCQGSDDVVITLDNPPTASNPVQINVQCLADVPVPDVTVVTDEVDDLTQNPLVTFISDLSDGNTCPEVITRTYRVTDDCGNQLDVQQTIIIEDTQVPVFGPEPIDITVECITDVPLMTNLDWTDNCDGSGVVTGIDGAIVGGACNGTITRTWAFTDACGNLASVSQVITIDDNQAPVFSNPPVDVTVECVGDVPLMTDLGWTDNCDGTGLVTGADGPILGGICGGTITRTWTHIDACGNVASVDQTITINDTQSPVLDAAPANVLVACIGDAPLMTALNWTDNCDGAGVVNGTDVSNGNSCFSIITRTWTYTDACGNTATASQTIIVNDATPPTASNPLNTFVLGSTIPPVDINVVFDEADNCAANPVVAFVSESSNGGLCPEIITRIYSVTDACGNTINVDHSIFLTDTLLPTASNPLPINVECIGDVPGFDIAVVTDEADNQGIPTVAFVSDVSDGNSCPEVITRTYSVTDICGGEIFVNQTITVLDITAPIFDPEPIDISVECVGDIPAIIDLGWTDNCDGTGLVTGTDGAIAGGNCGGSLTRTWTYADACGNTTSVDQLITINDTQVPVFSNPPANITVECVGDVPLVTDLGWTDNCDGAGVVTGIDGPIVGGNCGGTITRTWTYTDACGNASSVNQTIIINDTQTPVFAAPPLNISVECLADVPAMIDLNWTDNCDGAGLVTGADVSDGNTCAEIITRTWTYTDACGNIASVNQVITIDDITPPTASNPSTISVPLSIDVPLPDPTVVIDEADNCTVNPLVTWIGDVSDGNVCANEKITRTYSVMDDCGNVIFVTQDILIQSLFAPIDAGSDVTICIGDQVTLTAVNPLNVPIVWTPNPPVIADGQPFSPTQTQTYTVTADNLGCISTDDVLVTVEELPVISFFGDVLAGCEPLTVNFTNTSTQSSGALNCEWLINGTTINGCGNVTYLFENTGTYDVQLTVTSNTGCVNSLTFPGYIYVEALPEAIFSPPSIELSNLLTEVEFTNSSTGAVNYQWDFGDDFGTSTQENPSYTFSGDQSGTYQVQLVAFSPLLCTDTAFAVIRVIEELIYYIPNTFTPDGNEFNQLFKPIFESGFDPFDFEMLIFDRWGELIWESRDDQFGWDGTYNGSNVQSGMYNWKITFKTAASDERVEISGHVNLMR